MIVQRFVGLCGQPAPGGDVEGRQAGPAESVPRSIDIQPVKERGLGQVNGDGQRDSRDQPQRPAAMEYRAPAEQPAADPPGHGGRPVQRVIGLSINQAPAQCQRHEDAHRQQGEGPEGRDVDVPTLTSAGVRVDPRGKEHHRQGKRREPGGVPVAGERPGLLTYLDSGEDDAARCGGHQIAEKGILEAQGYPNVGAQTDEGGEQPELGPAIGHQVKVDVGGVEIDGDEQRCDGDEGHAGLRERRARTQIPAHAREDQGEGWRNDHAQGR